MKQRLAFPPDTLQLTPSSTTSSHRLSFLTINTLILIFTLYCIVSWNSTQLHKLNYPADSKGTTCYIDHPYSYPYLYIDLSLPSIHYRCVDDCPGSHNFFRITDQYQNTIQTGNVEERVNTRMGGVCWSIDKGQILLKRGMNKEMELKSLFLSNLTGLAYSCFAIIILGTLVPILIFVLPFKVVFGVTISVCFSLIATIIILTWSSHSTFLQTQTIIILVSLMVFLALVLFMNRDNMKEAFTHLQSIKTDFQEGSDSPLAIFVHCLKTPLVFSLIHCTMLVVVLLEYLALTSSQKLVKNKEEIYFSVQRSWWKYLFLLFQWLFHSHLLENLYQYIHTNTGYHLVNKSRLTCPSFSFSIISNIYHISCLHTLLWLPIKLTLLFKPYGAILRKQDKPSIGQQVSKLCYCCCGLALNYLDKLTFNPFLVVDVNGDQFEMETRLSLVQECYHKQNPWVGKSSFWTFRCASYLVIGLISYLVFLKLSIVPSTFSQSAFCHFFAILSVALGFEISQYQVTLWSRLGQVKQFVSLLQQQTHNTPKP